MRYVNVLRCKQAGTSKLVACPADSQDTGKDSAYHHWSFFGTYQQNGYFLGKGPVLNWGFLHCAMIVYTAFFCRISAYSAPRNNEMPASKGNFPPKSEDSDWGKKTLTPSTPCCSWRTNQTIKTTNTPSVQGTLTRPQVVQTRLSSKIPSKRSWWRFRWQPGMVFQDLRGGSISQDFRKKLW